MSGDATKVVGISDLLKGVVKMAPDAVGMIKAAPGLIRRPPDAKRTIGSIFAKRAACLLYTSPSPRDRTRSRMPSSA